MKYSIIETGPLSGMYLRTIETTHNNQCKWCKKMGSDILIIFHWPDVVEFKYSTDRKKYAAWKRKLKKKSIGGTYHKKCFDDMCNFNKTSLVGLFQA